MRLTSAHITLGILLGAIAVSPCRAQTRLTSLEDLRRELAAGDFITVVPAVGQPVAGRLIRLGDADLDLRVVDRRTAQRGPRDVTLSLDAIQSLARPHDAVRNGVATGAGIGAGFGGAMFVYAFAVDRNEMDEWAPFYARAAAVCTGIGALLGWAIDAANSKPHIRFDAASDRTATISVQPVYLQGGGIALAVSFAR